jgi:hypothetical protein
VQAFILAFGSKVLIFVACCAIAVFVIGVFAWLFVFEDASKKAKHPTSPTKPTAPAADQPLGPASV